MGVNSMTLVAKMPDPGAFSSPTLSAFDVLKRLSILSMAFSRFFTLIALSAVVMTCSS